MSDGAPRTHDDSSNICSIGSEGLLLSHRRETLYLPLPHDIANTVTLQSPTAAQARGGVSQRM